MPYAANLNTKDRKRKILKFIRPYQTIRRDPPARDGLVMMAQRIQSNPFQLCRFVAFYSRRSHNHLKSRIPETINAVFAAIIEMPAQEKAQGRAA